jgi:hypothetical protein
MDYNNSTPVLEYDRGASLNDHRGMHLLLWYWLGIITAVIAIGAWFFTSYFIKYDSIPGAFQSTTRLVGVAALFHILPATFAVSLGVYLRHRRECAVHYRGPLAPLIWAFIGFVLCGMVPALLGALILTIFYCSIAGLCLCSAPKSGELPSLFVQRRFRRFLFVTGTVIALLTASGYLSAILSRRSCEQKLARIVAVDIYHSAPFRLNSYASPDAARIFREGGFTALPPGPDRWERFPWGDVGEIRIECPFVISGEYASVSAPQNGSASRVRFLCLFGWIIELDTRLEWVT